MSRALFPQVVTGSTSVRCEASGMEAGSNLQLAVPEMGSLKVYDQFSAALNRAGSWPLQPPYSDRN